MTHTNAGTTTRSGRTLEQVSWQGLRTMLELGKDYTKGGRMRPIWKDNRLTVELHKRDEKVLRDARVIGKALAAMGQPTGQPLVEAVDAILGPSEGTLTPEQKLVKAIEEE